MTNRQMIMVKLIQLSDEEFADMLNDQIGDLMDGKICQICMENNHGICDAERAMIEGCPFDLVAWLKKQAC